MQTVIRKRDRFRHWGTVLEFIILGLGLCTIILGIFIFFQVGDMLPWLPVMFMTAALENIISSMKAFYYRKKLKGAGLFLAAFFIFAFAVVSYITLWM